MNIIINNSSMQPIYEQIVEQMKAEILKGDLVPDTMLPSVRTLSKDLRISALTVKKAYDALEQEGFVVTVHGKGSFVSSVNANLAIEQQRREVEKVMLEAIRMGRSCGMKNDEMKELFELMIEE
ncbi:MAG: GntR family transcriptional regulator [Lachnospiraceae bacterium]|nr:GntR family transcriptional regulator [Lachnospiraceae bacterium]